MLQVKGESRGARRARHHAGGMRDNGRCGMRFFTVAGDLREVRGRRVGAEWLQDCKGLPGEGAVQTGSCLSPGYALSIQEGSPPHRSRPDTPVLSHFPKPQPRGRAYMLQRKAAPFTGEREKAIPGTAERLLAEWGPQALVQQFCSMHCACFSPEGVASGPSEVASLCAGSC